MPFGDPDSNEKVEAEAIDRVKAIYREKGWAVESVESMNCGYDLRCVKGGQERHVEVKGCTGTGDRFIVTRNEHATGFSDPMFRIAVVANVLSDTQSVREFTARQFQEEFEFSAIQYMAQWIGDVLPENRSTD
jgi:hypothetical protein